jgi:uncharacterized protein
MMLFCDTSTLAKYYVVEQESVAVRALLDSEDEVFASELVRPELMATFHRRWREGKWSRDQFLTVARQFSHDDQDDYWSWIPLDVEIVTRTADAYKTLPKEVFLRTLDCVHLVTASYHGFSQIYTHDIHQANSAEAFGLRATSIR